MDDFRASQVWLPEGTCFTFKSRAQFDILQIDESS
jgi:hypothetical protein